MTTRGVASAHEVNTSTGILSKWQNDLYCFILFERSNNGSWLLKNVFGCRCSLKAAKHKNINIALFFCLNTVSVLTNGSEPHNVLLSKVMFHDLGFSNLRYNNCDFE